MLWQGAIGLIVDIVMKLYKKYIHTQLIHQFPDDYACSMRRIAHDQ